MTPKGIIKELTRNTMNKEELIQKLKDIEWEDFEVKEAVSEIPKSSWETVSAFSNTSGGWIVFGVSKRGKEYEIIGVEHPEKIEQDFTTVLRGQKFNQKIIGECKKYAFGPKTVLAFYIPHAKKKPVYFDNMKNSFIRSGSGDQRLTELEVDSLYRDSSFGTKDRELTNLTIKDLNKDSIKRYRTYLHNIKPEHQYNTLTDEEFLTKIRAIDNSKATIAGLLVFGTEDSIGKYFSDFKIDYLEIFGTSYEDAKKRYEFRLSDYPNIYEYFFAIYERIIKKIDVPFKLKGAFRDENQPQVKAIREALVNLLIHSDYFSQMKPRIRVFLNRIEFFNPGALPKPYEELQNGDISLPRNPIITRIFRVIDLAENAGYGFDKMFKGWKSHYSKAPVVSTGLDYYSIEFFYNSEGSARDTEKDTVRDTARDTVNLSRNQLRIISLIRETPFITSEELSKKIGINLRNIKNNIAKLKERMLIKRIGPDKGGYWAIQKNTK